MKSEPASAGAQWRRWRLAVTVFSALVALKTLLGRWTGVRDLTTYYHHGGQAAPLQNSDPGSWKWSDIKPSRKLQWERCYDSYDCARLDVPMDWLDPSEDNRVVIAVIRLRATELDDYRGPVIFNPGGPGGSGVYALKDRGRYLQSIVGKNHDIISFDPRGIGASVPRVACWDSPEKTRLWALQDVGVVDAHPGLVYDAFARAVAFSQACESNANSSKLLSHIGTPSHARDMLEIVHQTGNDRLKYWGFSYGTVLGGVFAAMYPDKIERLVSDGNVDYREWFHQSRINFLRDTDKVMAAFYRFCHEAGPLQCAFHAETPALIEDRLHRLLAEIKEHPVIIPVSESGPAMPQLITWSHVKRLTSRALYQPIYMFKNYARVLNALEAGDGKPFYELIKSENSAPPICSIEAIPPNVPRLEEGNDAAFPAIMCADSPPINQTVEDFASFVDQLVDISSSAGDVNALFRLACIGRTIRPKWTFNGPFKGNTSHPILYVANMADNISPLVSARNNSVGFPGSVILVQNSYGHTSLSAASACTASYIRAYFQDGSLPDAGTTCEPTYHPFENARQEKSPGDELAVAVEELAKAQWGFKSRLNLF
ncbi:alpha/beta-hydrolase [Xylariomycetidae sp. FL2044]|nr:alpha/beta-hydrolase [Xylariomycetidae sp. FL2044]